MTVTTILARSPSALLRRLNELVPVARERTVLFALSPNVPSSSLSKLVDRLTTLSDSTIGCLSAPLLASHISCSIAILPSWATTFRSTILGRDAPSVGRVRLPGRPPKQGPGIFTDKKPSFKEHVDSERTGIVYFTDSAPEGFLSALAASSNELQTLPTVPALGLIGTSTPFLTGRPVTLFHNHDILEQGAVGVVLSKSLVVTSSVTGAIPISNAMAVTQCQGNVINTLNGLNPAELLLEAIQQSGVKMKAAGSLNFKDDDETFMIGNGEYMYRITAGDLSRGNISLEPQNLAPLTMVKFYYLPKTKDEPELQIRSGLEFRTCVERLPDTDDGSWFEDNKPLLELEDSFIGYSSASTSGKYLFDCDHKDDNAIDVVENTTSTPATMGQTSSRQQRPRTNSAASAAGRGGIIGTEDNAQQPAEPDETASTSRRQATRQIQVLAQVTPLLPEAEQSSEESASESSSSTTLPLGPTDEKGEDDHLDDSHDPQQQGEASSSPALSSDQPSTVASVPILEPTVVDDSAVEDNLDPLEAPAPSAATPEPEGPAPSTNSPQHQFPPPGTLVVVQGVVHTTDVPRPSQVPDAPPRASSTPPSSRNRLSTLLHSRPSSRTSFSPSSTTLDSPPVSDEPPPSSAPVLTPPAETGPISSGSIDVLGTLLRQVPVAAAATAASLLTGTTEPLHLPSSIGNSPSASPESSAPRPTSPTPTSGLDATRAERLRQAWGGIRERLGLRPHTTATTTTPSMTPGVGADTPSDPREHLFGQMARAFNLGLGLATENASLGPRDSTSSNNTHDTNPTGVTPAEPPAEGSFERFLLDLQTDLRAALSPPPAPADTTPATNSAEPAHESQESESEPEDAPSHEDDDDDNEGLYDDMPALGEVSDSDTESEFEDTSEDLREETSAALSTPLPTAARNSLPDVDAQGRINWWRLYRFAPITVPPNAQPGQGIPTALLPTSQTTTNPSTHPPTPPQPAVAPPPLPLDPTLAELPFFDDVPDTPQLDAQAQAQTVVPVIVVGVQSVVAPWPQASSTANNTGENAGTGVPEEPAPPPAPESVSAEGNRGRGWHSRAAEAFRNLRPGRRNRTATPTNPGSRTFLIYVIGGYYPPNHSILNGGPETLASLEALLELADLLGHSKPPTVSKEDIEKSGLEIIKATQLGQYEREERIAYNCTERCLICLDDYQPEDDIRVMKCRHAFHQSCVDKWLETGRNNCPACRSKGVSLDGTTDA
ncbi:hypothetical protein C0995_006388 [Termitomyces sp. Mi166|nr:hypothetical protein C0995_006388 [Termitomyces sp. Mi166\